MADMAQYLGNGYFSHNEALLIGKKLADAGFEVSIKLTQQSREGFYAGSQTPTHGEVNVQMDHNTYGDLDAMMDLREKIEKAGYQCQFDGGSSMSIMGKA